jgi:hypothetical protein
VCSIHTFLHTHVSFAVFILFYSDVCCTQSVLTFQQCRILLNGYQKQHIAISHNQSLKELAYLSQYSVSLQTGQQDCSSFPGRTSVFRPAPRPTQPSIQWVPRVERCRSVTLTAHSHPAHRSRIFPLHLIACMAAVGEILFYKQLLKETH